MNEQVPLYKASIQVKPAPNARVKSEMPFASMGDPSVWQYGDRVIEAGEVFESKEWPHGSFRAMNPVAERVLSYFRVAMRARLPRSPFSDDGRRLLLDDGLSAVAIGRVPPPNIPKPFGGKTAA